MSENNDIIEDYDDYNPTPVELILSVYQEQEDKISHSCIYLPSKYRENLDNIPDGLCIRKECGYMTVALISHENIMKILAFLFGKDEIKNDVKKFITENKAGTYRLTGFWD